MKNKYSILFIIAVFAVISALFIGKDKVYIVNDVISPSKIVLNSREINLTDINYLDSSFTEKNKELAKKLNISEEEAFIIGNLSKYWASETLKGRHVYLTRNSDLIYLKYSYKKRFNYSGFCLKNGKPFYDEGFRKKIDEIRHTKYMVVDLEGDKIYEVNSPEVKHLNSYLVIKKAHLPRNLYAKHGGVHSVSAAVPASYSEGNIKVFFSDLTTKLKPDRTCNTSVCREILDNINNSKESIDMAVYGYSRTPALEYALISAKKRGVKIRLVYDSGLNGGNIYPDTDILKKLLPDNISDMHTKEAQNIMHNKFYIFDNKIVITGSANLSHTDMSGFNSNSVVVINSKETAGVYKQEFEQMFRGKFHNDKTAIPDKHINLQGTEINIYFSPKDKAVENAVIPLIRNSKKYIYIPVFVLTDKKIVSELISALKRGVDVKIIIDALNASVKHSKHKELRLGGIPIKTENYAGKMHSKSMIIDDEYTIIGSMNFSYSGENKNDENLIVIKSTDIAKAYKLFFLYQWNKIDDKWLKLNARAEGKDSIGSCSDGLDNNYDGLTDMDDPACR